MSKITPELESIANSRSGEHDPQHYAGDLDTQTSAPYWAVVGIFLLLVIWGVGFARSFLMPVVLALLANLVLSPVRRQMGRIGIPAPAAAVGIVSSLVAVLVAGLLLLAEPVSEWMEDAPNIGYQIERKLEGVKGSVEPVVKATKAAEKITKTEVEPGVEEVVVREKSPMANLANIAPSIFAQTIFALVLLMFLLASGEMIYEKIVYVIPKISDKRRAMRVAHDIERTLSRYLFAITMINAGLGVAVGFTMYLLGMPQPILFGAMAFALNYIPYFGGLAGILIASVVAFLHFDPVGMVFAVAGSYFFLTTLEGQIITPLLVGKSLRMNTVVVFLAVAVWAWLWSVVGMFVAVPLLVSLKVFCDHFDRLRGLGNFLSARGAEVVDDSVISEEMEEKEA